jgi:hypothetical protein
MWMLQQELSCFGIMPLIHIYSVKNDTKLSEINMHNLIPCKKVITIWMVN